MSRARTGWLMPLSIIVALLLGLLPLPDVLQPLRPYWLALVVAYWVIEAPDSAGLSFAVIVGLVADLISVSYTHLDVYKRQGRFLYQNSYAPCGKGF